MNKNKLIKKFDRQAKMYQQNIENPAMTMWRKKLISYANGKVLEVGVGAGANFPFYDKERVSVTAVDFSSKMIEVAELSARRYQIDAEFIKSDVEKLDFELNTFDCIVSTLTLCSYPNPIEVLNKFNNWCKTGGIVLLMEHGLSSNPFISSGLKIINPVYKIFSGCHCNRDILKIIEESRLNIDHYERYWKGIFYLVWAKPTK